MTEPAERVKYRHPSEAEAEAAWEETHRAHRTTEDRGCVYCHTCGLTYWRRRKP